MYNLKKPILSLEETFNNLGIKPSSIRFESNSSIPIYRSKCLLEAELSLSGVDERPDENYDPEQLAMGMKVEMEHTKDEDVAKRIAKDHLDEIPTYYSRLKIVEKPTQVS